jgi:hypothetical protein
VSKQGPAHERNKTSKTAGAEKIRLLGLSANFFVLWGSRARIEEFTHKKTVAERQEGNKKSSFT